MSYRKTQNFSYDGVGNGNDSVVHVPVCTYSPIGPPPVKCTKLPDGCPLTTGCMAIPSDGGAGQNHYFPTLCKGPEQTPKCSCSNLATGMGHGYGGVFTMIPADILRQGTLSPAQAKYISSGHPSAGRNPTVTYVSNKLAILPRLSPQGDGGGSYKSSGVRNNHQFWCYVAEKSIGNSSDCKQYLAPAAGGSGCGDGKSIFTESPSNCKGIPQLAIPPENSENYPAYVTLSPGNNNTCWSEVYNKKLWGSFSIFDIKKNYGALPMGISPEEYYNTYCSPKASPSPGSSYYPYPGKKLGCPLLPPSGGWAPPPPMT